MGALWGAAPSRAPVVAVHAGWPYWRACRHMGTTNGITVFPGCLQTRQDQGLDWGGHSQPVGGIKDGLLDLGSMCQVRAVAQGDP